MTAGDVIVVRGELDSRQCAAFDGTDDYILADAHAVARVAANDTVGTYSAWIFADNITGEYTILSAGDNDNANEYLSFKVNLGKLVIRLQQGGVEQFSITETIGSITAKKWTYVAVVQNGTQPALYVNGVKRTTINSVATDLTMWYDELANCDKFAIGVLESNNTHTLDFNGMISDVKYWSKDLNAKQILDDYQGNTADPTVTAALESHWDMDGDVTDAGLGADNGTLTGHAYIAGWGSEWSRQVELNAVVADDLQTIAGKSGTAETLILKAA